MHFGPRLVFKLYLNGRNSINRWLPIFSYQQVLLNLGKKVNCCPLLVLVEELGLLSDEIREFWVIEILVLNSHLRL